VTDGSRITETTQRLVDDLRPVRRLWSPGARTALWVALEALMLLYLLATRARGDLGALLTMPGVLLELAAVVTASILLARLAFAAGVPGHAVHPGVRVVAFACVALAGVHVLTLPFRTDLPLSAFAAGAHCGAQTAVLAFVPWLVILVALRRAAPFRGALAGALAAGAAFLMAFAFQRLICPVDDMLHLLAWHGLPVVAAVLVSALVGALWLPRWRR
jgi:hypothetical protein